MTTMDFPRMKYENKIIALKMGIIVMTL